jgi:DNA ligase (NAD+)
MDIEGLGKEVIEALVSGGLVNAPADLYRLDVDSLTALPLANGQLYGATRATKLHAAIEASRAKPFSTVLHALGAPGVGYPECRAIAQHFDLADLLARRAGAAGTLRDELTALHGIGPATAEAVDRFLDENAAWIGQLQAVGLRVTHEDAPHQADGPLTGKTFVVTGSLEMGSREDVEAWIRSRGGTVSGSVSSQTNYLVAGIKPGGSKTKAAAKHGVTILSELELQAIADAESIAQSDAG